VLDGWPTDLWDALVFNVVGQQLSVAATRAILAQLEALHGGRLPTPVELLATDTETLRGVGLSRAKTVYLRDLAERLVGDRRRRVELPHSLDGTPESLVGRRPDVRSAQGEPSTRSATAFAAGERSPPSIKTPVRGEPPDTLDLHQLRAGRVVVETPQPLKIQPTVRLSLSVRSPRGIALPHRAANHRGNDRVRWPRLPAEWSDRVPGIPSCPA
jgi:hypothetical protein